MLAGRIWVKSTVEKPAVRTVTLWKKATKKLSQKFKVPKVAGLWYSLIRVEMVPKANKKAEAPRTIFVWKRRRFSGCFSSKLVYLLKNPKPPVMMRKEMVRMTSGSV